MSKDVGTGSTSNTVAEAAQVSRQTVTNVLRHPERVAPETLSRVQAEIVRLGYRPSAAAQSLQAQRAGAIGVELNALGAEYHNAVMAPFVAELTLAAPSHDLPHGDVRVADPHPDPGELPAAVARPRRRRLRARRHPLRRPAPGLAARPGHPLLVLRPGLGRPDFTRWVDVDGHHGTGLAVAHCVQAGYATIGYLGSPAGVSVVADARRAGWLDGCGTAGREPGPDLSGPDELDAVRRVADEVVAAVGPGGAVVAPPTCWRWACSTPSGGPACGPGRDVGVVGFDDSELARMHGLSSVSQPLGQVASIALALVAESLSADESRDEGVLLRPGLTARSSDSTSSTTK